MKSVRFEVWNNYTLLRVCSLKLAVPCKASWSSICTERSGARVHQEPSCNPRIIPTNDFEDKSGFPGSLRVILIQFPRTILRISPGSILDPCWTFLKRGNCWGGIPQGYRCALILIYNSCDQSFCRSPVCFFQFVPFSTHLVALSTAAQELALGAIADYAIPRPHPDD